jgi:hypothetical protein
MTPANTRTNIGADKAKKRAHLLIIDHCPATAAIAHIRLTDHSMTAIINTVHPVYGLGNSSAPGKLYVQNDRTPPVAILIAVRIIDITGNSMAGCDPS